MKRLLIATITAALTIGAVPASAATVDGFNYADAGLIYLGEACAGVYQNPTRDVDALYDTDSRTGTHSTGRDVADAANFFGVETFVGTPSTLQTISFATYHFGTPDVNTTADGYFRVRYDGDGGGFGNGFWVGYLPLDKSSTGWITWSNYATTPLEWFTSGGTSLPGVTGSIATVASSEGNNGGAYVGFGFGCDGRDYLMDDFRVRTSTRNSVYDFEGPRTASYISSNPTHHSDELKRGITKFRMTNGQSHWLLGDAYGLGDEVLTAGYIDGTASLYAKEYGKSSYKKVSSKTFSSATYGSFEVSPARRTLYQIRTTPSADYSGYESSTSATLTIEVERRVKARAESTKVRKGQRIQLKGQVFPKEKRVKVFLQRKVGGKWRKIARTTTRKKGKYSVSARATSTGKWQVRIKVAKAKGNLGNVTSSLEIKVIKPRRPAVSTPGNTGTPVPEIYYPDDDGIKGRRATEIRKGSVLVGEVPSLGERHWR